MANKQNAKAGFAGAHGSARSSNHTYLFVGAKVYVLGAGLFGTITRITKDRIVWVRVKSRWGNHHHPATCKTFRYPEDRIAPEEAAEAPNDPSSPTAHRDDEKR